MNLKKEKNRKEIELQDLFCQYRILECEATELWAKCYMAKRKMAKNRANENLVLSITSQILISGLCAIGSLSLCTKYLSPEATLVIMVPMSILSVALGSYCGDKIESTDFFNQFIIDKSKNAYESFKSRYEAIKAKQKEIAKQIAVLESEMGLSKK